MKRVKDALSNARPSTASPEELKELFKSSTPSNTESESSPYKDVKVNVVPTKNVRQSTTNTRRYTTMSATITVIGNLTGMPELRQTASGKSVVNFSLAYTPRKPDGSDGQTSFYNIVAWEYLADNFAASFKTGDRLIVVGRVTQDKWTDKDTEKVMSRLSITADEIGGTCRFHTVEMSKVRKVVAQPSEGEVSSDEEQDIFA